MPCRQAKRSSHWDLLSKIESSCFEGMLPGMTSAIPPSIARPTLCLCLALTAFALAAVVGVTEGTRIISSPEPDWPQFRGPRRDGVCDERGLLKSWPESG